MNNGILRGAAAVAVCVLWTMGASQAASIKWSRSFSSAMAEAKRTKKLVMVDFYTDW